VGGCHWAGAGHRRVTSPGMPPAPGPRPALSARPPAGAGVRLGLRANLAQFALLVAVNALVGGTLGQERTVVPLLAEQTFHLAAFSSALTFILAFGAVKAVTNFFAGTLSDRFGRKPVLVAGWLVALPIPPLLIWAPNWGWVVAANVLLGVNQGLTWSTTVIMKIDLAGPARRGLAMGLNEAAGYGAVAITALATGYLATAYGLRPAPFLLGAAYIALGLGLSAATVRETRGHARHEAADHVATADHLGGHLTTRQVAWLTSFSEPALSAACQAGMVNNLNDGVAWGLFPILFARHGLTISQIGVLAALYPAVWGAGQLATGALSDRIGRKWLIATGMGVQAAAISLVAAGTTFTAWALAAVLLGVGTAMVYPTLLAAVGDVAHPAWRARSVGVYRLWRDGGFAVGALLAGLVADAFGILAAIWVVAALTAASGLIVAVRMYETRPSRPAG
jgi:MFS family permease